MRCGGARKYASGPTRLSMHLIRHSLLISGLFCAILMASVHAQSTRPASMNSPGMPARPRSDSELLADDLTSKDVDRQTQAVAKIRDAMESESGKAVNELRSRWLKAMIAGGRYEDAAELALAAILFQPQKTQNVQAFQDARVRALLAAGKKQEALSNAKSLFNVAPMNSTADAMLLVAECLRANDPDSADRFREEQIAGATTRPATTQPATQEAAKSSAVLAGIKVDPKPYEDAIAAQNGEDYNSLVALGNLLLLADKPKEAKAAFERAYAVAPDRQLAQATENIARAIKAEDGTIGRANSWILSLRPAK